MDPTASPPKPPPASKSTTASSGEKPKKKAAAPPPASDPEREQLLRALFTEFADFTACVPLDSLRTASRAPSYVVCSPALAATTGRRRTSSTG